MLKVLKDYLTHFLYARQKLWQSIDVHQRSVVVLLTRVAILLVSILLSPSLFAQGQGLVKGEIGKAGESTHIEFSGQSNWNYDVKKKESGGKTVLEINIPPLDAGSITALSSWKDEFVSKVQVNPNGPDGLTVVQLELADGKLDFFDYQTDQPSRLIVDLFKAKQKAAVVEKAPEVAPKSKSAKTISVKKLERSIASDINLVENNLSDETPASAGKGIFDGGDPGFERFSIKDHEIKEDAIIRSKENVYVFFPMLLVENEHFNKIKSQVPIYSIVPRPKDSENELARFLVTLYERKRLNVYLKTVQMFLNKYPRSEYDEIIRFMTADVYFELWQENKSRTIFNTALRSYREAIERHPESKLADRSDFLLAYASYNNLDYLNTIRAFEKFLQEHPAGELNDRAKLGIARAFLKLKKFPQAYTYYEDVQKNGVEQATKVEAAYLKGDVAFMARDYDKSLEYYKAALKEHPGQVDQFPNAFYNLAESYFWKGKYKEGLEGYKDYLKRFPSHSHGGYAMTRVGEILDILGADKNRVMGAWLETYFRYGKTPGAAVARMRTLSQKMGQMKPKESEQAIEEIREIAKRSELPKIDLFATLAISEGYAQRKDYIKATEELLAWYRANPTTVDGQIISTRVVRNINDELSHNVEKGNFLSALKVHNEYAEQWLKGSNRVDTIYNLGKAFEQAGAFKQADQLFKDSLNRLMAVKGTPLEKERGIFEVLPTESQIHLRLAKVAMDSGRYSESYDYLKEITTPEKMTDNEQIERVEIAAKVLETKGDKESAARYLKELVDNWKGEVDLVSAPTLKLAKLQYELKKFDLAEKNLIKVNNLFIDSGRIPSTGHAESLSLLGQIYHQQKNSEKCIETWNDLLSKYEGNMPLESIRFKLGELHFAQGNIQKAAEIWDPLKEGKNSFWYNLGQEKLKDVAWSKDYKKYIQRIPAMAEMK